MIQRLADIRVVGDRVDPRHAAGIHGFHAILDQGRGIYQQTGGDAFDQPVPFQAAAIASSMPVSLATICASIAASG